MGTEKHSPASEVLEEASGADGGAGDTRVLKVLLDQGLICDAKHQHFLKASGDEKDVLSKCKAWGYLPPEISFRLGRVL